MPPSPSVTLNVSFVCTSHHKIIHRSAWQTKPVAFRGTLRSVQTKRYRQSFASGKNTIMTRGDYNCNLQVHKKMKLNKFT